MAALEGSSREHEGGNVGARREEPKPAGLSSPRYLYPVLSKFKSKARISIFSPILPVSEMVEWKRYSILKRKMSVEAKNYEGRTTMHNSAEAEIGVKDDQWRSRTDHFTCSSFLRFFWSGIIEARGRYSEEMCHPKLKTYLPMSEMMGDENQRCWTW